MHAEIGDLQVAFDDFRTWLHVLDVCEQIVHWSASLLNLGLSGGLAFQVNLKEKKKTPAGERCPYTFGARREPLTVSCRLS